MKAQSNQKKQKSSDRPTISRRKPRPKPGGGGGEGETGTGQSGPGKK